MKSAELVNLANKWLLNTCVLWPGLVGLDDHDLQKELGYFPKNVSFEWNILVLKKLKSMALAVITASQLQTERKKSVGIVSSANEMPKAHTIIDNL